MEKIKIIIDTNLWISLLIGKKLTELSNLCNNNLISVYICEELKIEFLRIAFRDKIKKYVTEQRIVDTLELIETSCISVTINNTIILSDLRDPNDMYLLDLAEKINADYILTGDNDLLVLRNHRQTKIVSFMEFMTIKGKFY